MFLVGDFVPGKCAISLPAEFHDENILANLEGAVCDDCLKISDKVGVALHSSPFQLKGKWSFALANNHMMDYCKEGVVQTRVFLEKHGWKFAGAGDGVAEARKPMIVSENGFHIAVFSCCERQFGIADGNDFGVAEKGLWLFKGIRQVKENNEADFVIVSCHAASEFSPWISPRLRSFYHFLIDVGADVIHGHHAHVPQGYEEYKGRPIFYGLGNFVIDPAAWGRSNPNFFWSEVANVEFSRDQIRWFVKPVEVSRKENTISVVEASERNKIGYSRYLQMANLQFQSKDSVEGCWQEASVRLYPRLYSQILRAAPVRRRRLSVKARLRKLYFDLADIGYAILGMEFVSAKSIFYAKVLYSFFNCESHADMIQTALGLQTGVLPDRRSKEIQTAADNLRVGI